MRQVAQETRFRLGRRWERLRDAYLPIAPAETFWRISRNTRRDEPTQGWKLHLSSTVLQACDLFERVLPLLAERDLRFKGPDTLDRLIDINAGVRYGYPQVGKIVTIYPPSEEAAVELAEKLHEITREFDIVKVPFDNQYLHNSNIFYRYGKFLDVHFHGPAVSSGELFYDDRLVPVPNWINDPFKSASVEGNPDSSVAVTPLVTTYRVIDAITQRGKGGTYRAIDFSASPPRLCVIKQGRFNGELDWNGSDGRSRIDNERRNLIELGRRYEGCPRVFSKFEIAGDIFLVLEHIDGVTIQEMMKTRRLRFRIRQVVNFAIEIAKVLHKIAEAGWVWNDCKPSNLIVTRTGEVRPIDFENAHRANATALFDWRSERYSEEETSDDSYSLGAVVYLLLSGQYYDPKHNVPISKHRRRVPFALEDLLKSLLVRKDVSLTVALSKLVEIRDSL